MEYPLGAYLDDYAILDQPGVSAQLTDMVRIYPWFTLGRYIHLRSLQRSDTVAHNRAARLLDVRLFAHPYPRILIEEDASISFARQSLTESTYNTDTENDYSEDQYYTQSPQQEETSYIIDNYLNRNSTERIVPPPMPMMGGDHNYYQQDDISEESVRDDGQIASETLAQIYIAQGQPERAIEIYYTLSLKYPEKSVFFANCIADLRAQHSIW